MRLVPRLLLFLSMLGLSGCRQAPVAAWQPERGSPRRAQVDLRVAGKPQARSLSCESRSACDLLGYYGWSVAESRFLAGLPRSDNPDLGFVGDVDGPGEQLPPAGYGVHAEPIAAQLRLLGCPARADRGRDLRWLLDQLAAGRPVIVWATGTLQAGTAIELHDARGTPYVAVRGEHTFLAVGYAPGEILLLDPVVGRTRRVPTRRFDAAWAVLGRMAVVVLPGEGP